MDNKSNIWTIFVPFSEPFANTYGLSHNYQKAVFMALLASLIQNFPENNLMNTLCKPLSRFTGWLLFLLIVISSIYIGAHILDKAKISSVPKLSCISYSPSLSWLKNYNIKIPRSSVEKDLAQIKTISNCIRTYTTTENIEYIPEIAKSLDMQVILGLWIDRYGITTKDEFLALDKLLKDFDNSKGTISTIVIGNETALFKRATDKQMYAYIQRVKKETTIPVAIADVFSKLNEGAYASSSEVADIIGVHIFPYWDMDGSAGILENTKKQFAQIEKLYPKKKVLLYETGWPTRGFPFGNSIPSAEIQTLFLHELASDGEIPHPFNVIEAFDQPFKITKTDEGLTGAQWGIWDSLRLPKSTGVTFYLYISILLSTLLSLLFSHFSKIVLFKNYLHTLLWSFVLVVINILGISLAYSLIEYMIYIPGGQLLVVLQLSLTCIVLWTIKTAAISLFVDKDSAIGLESGHIDNSRSKVMKLKADEALLQKINENFSQNFVSIHIPCAGEAPEILKDAIESCLKLDYPAFEILVGINNTDSDKYKELFDYYSKQNKSSDRKAVHCFDFGKITGAKSGALNLLLKKTNNKAKYIAVIDSDYIVHSDWLSTMMQELFIANIDARQTRVKTKAAMARQHYIPSNLPIRAAAELEQVLCFSLNQRARQSQNSVLLNGTMCVIEKKTLEDIGAWPMNNICEDTEIGISIQSLGHRVLFIDKILGGGVSPSTFATFAKQHSRWAHGGVTNLKVLFKNYFFNTESRLTFRQLSDYFMSWSPWFLQAFLIVFFLGSLFGTFFMYQSYRLFPTPTMLIFPFASYISYYIFSLLISKRMSEFTYKQIARSFMYYIALSPYIADGILSGIFGLKRPFNVTSKSKNGMKREKVSSLSIFFILSFIAEIYFIVSRYGLKYTDIYVWILFLLTITLPAFAELWIVSLSPRFAKMTKTAREKHVRSN